MSRRKSDADQEFGSDSFLDIIANIVGILIILIVVAGVKVARQAETRDPVAVKLAQNSDLIAKAIGDDELPDADTVAQTLWPWQDESADSPQPSSESAPKFSEDELEAIRVELALLEAEQAELQTEIEELERRHESSLQQLDEATTTLAGLTDELTEQTGEDEQSLVKFASLPSRQTETKLRIAELNKKLASGTRQQQLFEGTLGTLEDRQRYVHNAMQQVSQETRKLREILEQNQESAPKSDLLNHRLSPVSRPVADDELHFRLSGGRIAHVPLEDLLERLKAQMMNRVNLVAKFHRYNGSVGPVQGFRMEYLVERQPLPPMQALQYGKSPYQLSVSRWQIHPTEALTAETVEEALQLGSRFRQILERTYPETAITIWLYPGDFEHFHRLRQFAHQLDLRVAARPLPNGFPITASPSGSRSTSQ